MISINQLSISFSGNTLFDQLSFIVKDKDRIGLTGRNGAGKSTLLKILSGKQSADSGQIILTTGHQIGYLPQEMIPDSTKTVLDEALTAFETLSFLEDQIAEYGRQLANREDYESEEYNKIIHLYHEANERFLMLGGNNTQAQTEKILLGLGFKHSDFSRPITEFSSGWQMRVELAKILLRRPEVMLLDEPTNHLDIESIQWLETFLQSYYGAVVLVSHDRTFLDQVTNRTIEIVLGKMEDYNVPYSEYLVQRAERRATQLSAYNNQQREIENMEKFVERFRYKASKAKQAQARLKALDKMERVEIDEVDTSSISFKFPPAPHSGKISFSSENLSKSYGEKLIFSNVDLCVEKGEKVAFVGKNGEGKSTFSKIVVGDINDYKGVFSLGHQIKIGYFAQNQAALLDGEKTVFETLDEIAVGDVRPKIRNILGCFLFSGDEIDKKVHVLSGGEKTRLAIAKLLLEPVNLLVLDEPTNHLDMVSKDILKSALLRYDGSLLIVSHDRDFLEGLTSKVYEFKDGHVKLHIGDVRQFLEDRRIQTLNDLNIIQKLESKNESSSISKKIDWEEKKQIEREARKRQSQIDKIESEIEKIESKIQDIEKKLSEQTPDLSSPLFVEYEQCKSLLECKMQEWEDLQK